jgi:hypothetical protein
MTIIQIPFTPYNCHRCGVRVIEEVRDEECSLAPAESGGRHYLRAADLSPVPAPDANRERVISASIDAAPRLPHGYETDHAALRAVVTLYSEATTDTTIAYYAVPHGTDHQAHLDRMTRLDSGTRELRSLLAQLYPADVRARLSALGRAVSVQLPADRAWYQRLSADALARLDGDMSRPLPESADLDVPPATVAVGADRDMPIGIFAVRPMEQPAPPLPIATDRPFIETHDEHPIEHG